MITEIAAKIRKSADRRSKIAMFHLQVLLHARQLKAMHPKEFCQLVKVPVSYSTEFRKMIRLARLIDDEGMQLK